MAKVCLARTLLSRDHDPLVQRDDAITSDLLSISQSVQLQYFDEKKLLANPSNIVTSHYQS
jgi:hypothetical protein